MRRLWSLVLAATALFFLVACESPAALGASCDRNSQCASPLVCRLERCRSECVENRDCPLGAECLRGSDGLGACSLPVDRGCTSGGTTCPMPLTCVGDQCVNTCSAMRDCPDDGECRPVSGTAVSFCFAPDRALDAGTTEDAGVPSDAGPLCAAGGCHRSLCVGDQFACAIHTNGTVGCWGANNHGQLGDGANEMTPATHVDASFDYSATPVTVIDDAGDPIVANGLACAERSACAILASDGSIVCWGSEGGAGAAQSGDRARPEPARAHAAMLGSGYVDIHAGRYHYCASRDGDGDGSAACWGDAGDGELGDGTSPVDAIDTMAGTTWGGMHLSLANGVTCGLRDGHVRCSGGDNDGSIGPNATAFPQDQLVAVDVPLSSPASDLATATGVGCALESNQIECWGWAAQGSLGYDVTGAIHDDCEGVTGAASPCHRQPSPVTITGGPYVRLFSGGFTAFVCAQAQDGTISCWGELSTGDCAFVAGRCRVPVRVPLLDGATEIAMGTSCTCARRADGSVVCIGANDVGELGRGMVDPVGMIRYDDVSVRGY